MWMHNVDMCRLVSRTPVIADNRPDTDILPNLLIWHAADVLTQLICITVTVCRPLYKDRRKWFFPMKSLTSVGCLAVKEKALGF